MSETSARDVRFAGHGPFHRRALTPRTNTRALTSTRASFVPKSREAIPKKRAPLSLSQRAILPGAYIGIDARLLDPFAAL